MAALALALALALLGGRCAAAQGGGGRTAQAVPCADGHAAQTSLEYVRRIQQPAKDACPRARYYFLDASTLLADQFDTRGFAARVLARARARA